MSLYIKMYRRRRLVSYSLIGLLFFGALVFFNQYTDVDTSIESRKGQKVNKRSGSGININTYVQLTCSFPLDVGIGNIIRHYP